MFSKKIKLITLFSLLLCGSLQAAHTGGSITGIVVDAVTGKALSGAHVYILNSDIGTVTDREGHFTLRAENHHAVLVISYMGYEEHFHHHSMGEMENSGLTIELNPKLMQSDNLYVSAGRMNMAYSGIYSGAKTRPVEDHMSSIPGLDMVTRTHFAKDPVIRGLRDARVNVMIDGMRLTPACVDGMDPVTAYVETDNLKSIEISRGQESYPLFSTAPGGSVNFAMARPSFDSGLNGSAETGYHFVNNQQMVQGALSYGREELAVRFSGTYRNAGDLMAGNGSRITDSGLEKGNLFASILYQPVDDHQLNLRYIGDFAGKIGYPKLIMDTRRADAHIAGLEHAWKNPSSRINNVTSNLYVNRVEHWMDDYSRDVTQREVMKDMNMPMYGKTMTAGLTSELNASIGSHLLNAKFEIYAVRAYADMLMEPVNADVRDMYLVNLGDVSQRNASLSGSHRYYTDNGWVIGSNVQLEIGTNRIHEQSAVATYRAEYPELNDLEPTQIVYSIGFDAEKRLSERVRTGVRLTDSYRLPDHMERYGYYIYQPLDGFFYHGNPGLGTERSSQAELFVTYGNDRTRWNGSSSIWVNRMDNYIAGIRDENLFKRFENMGVALLTGFEMNLNVRMAGRWDGGAAASYVFGQHNELDEPLPMIPPLKGSLFVQRESDIISFETRLRWAAPQNRIAEQNSLESPTGSYALLDIYGKTSLTGSITLQAGVENVLNIYYVDHLSVNSMPGGGRNVHLSLKYSF